MIEIKLYTSASHGIEISHELDDKGYCKGIEYDFAYHKPNFDSITGHQKEAKHVIFTFHDEYESIASWFRLKYE